ncbi:DUF4198 domain-containing protein [Robertkochia aurantiaca]|uniref:DUF4198 domain-containing protein n=1 Tax=Robertkochia aurantiaca TaxID=2873700 RepID=UPI001CCCFFBC|nr:DUF4198 domain-containing protein [Robertkochia sp. 3YJGBD-33]
MKKVFVFVLLGMLFSSHELFIKSKSYFLDPGDTYELQLFNGTFAVSENSITSDRITNAKITGPDYSKAISSEIFSQDETKTYFPFTASSEGTYVVGVSTLPREIELSAEDFDDYLVHEGLLTTRQSRMMNGANKNPVRERYSKHVKTLLQVGNSKTENFTAIMGYPIEFVPKDNPYNTAVGDQIRFQLLSYGKPLGEQIVQYGYMKYGNMAEERTAVTDENGMVSIKADSSGDWYLATIHMEESEETELDYVSNWTTITFGMR